MSTRGARSGSSTNPDGPVFQAFHCRAISSRPADAGNVNIVVGGGGGVDVKGLIVFIAAINATAEFTAAGAGATTGTISTTEFGPITTGGTGDAYVTTVEPTGADNTVTLTAVGAGTFFGGLAVTFVDDADLTGNGDESAEYDVVTNTLTVTIRDGVTTAADVIAALNAGAHANPCFAG